jgi:hypothetical protein
MDAKIRFLNFLFALVLIAFPSSAEESGYYVERTGNELRFYQRLAWTADEYALRYEVIIQKEDRGNYGEKLRESTENSFIDVSLEAGRYRYCVIPYDLLERPVEASEWTSFEIIFAMNPRIIKFSPSAFYLDEDVVWILDIDGTELDPAAELYLRRPGTDLPVIVPIELQVNRGGLSAVFAKDQLKPGNYEIYIKNPGGLDASTGKFSIFHRRYVDLYLGLSYSPYFPLYGEINTLLSSNFLPAGLMASFTAVPLKFDFGYLGLQASAVWYYFESKNHDYETSYHSIGAEFNVVFQHRLFNRTMIFSAHAGAGLNAVINFHFRYSSGSTPPINILIPQIQLGSSFLWIVRRPLYLEAGMNYLHWLSNDTFSPGYLRFRAGAGWIF